MFKLIIGEIKASLKSRLYLMILLVIPLILSLFTGHIMVKTRVPSDLAIAVLDQDSSQISREVTTHIDALPGLAVSFRVEDEAAGRKLLYSGKARGFVVIPKDFSRNIRRGTQARLIVYEDFNFLLPGRTIAKNMVALEGWLQQRYFSQFFEKKGISGYSKQFLSSLGKIEYHKLFNPNLEYTQFLLPGFLLAILYQVICVISGMILFSSHSLYRGKSRFSFIVSKLAAHLILSLLPFLLIYGLLFPWFSLQTGNFFQALSLFIPFSMATLLIGMLVSVIVREPVFTTEIMIVLGAVGFPISGYTWPMKMFPGAARFIAHLLPLTEFFNNSSKVWYNTGFYVTPLGIWAFVPVLAIPVFMLSRRIFNEKSV